MYGYKIDSYLYVHVCINEDVHTYIIVCTHAHVHVVAYTHAHVHVVACTCVLPTADAQVHRGQSSDRTESDEE